jgi:polo-like kinase 1
LQLFATFLIHVIAGVKAEPVNSPATADTPFLAVPSGHQSPKQLLRDLQQQLFKLFSSKPNKKVRILMGYVFFLIPLK